MEKIIRDGKVAIAVSYGYGAGWSTWCNVNPMDARFNQLFLDGNLDAIRAIAEDTLEGDDKYLYTGGIDDVEIEWIPLGTKFYINEYDGSESIITEDQMMTA